METGAPSRYLRLITSNASPELLSKLGPRVPWLTQLPIYSHNLKIAHEPDYDAGLFIGFDAASAAACEALDVKPGHKVLDLCCAPGAKLSALAHLMQYHGELIGVDLNPKRLDIATSIMKKYRIASIKEEVKWNLSLMLADGLSFNPLTCSGTPIWTTAMDSMFYSTKVGDKRRHANKGMRKKLSKIEPPSLPDSFDRVMVDAECTTDARSHHSNELVYKKIKVPSSIEEITEIQYGLLNNGFRLCKPGGYVVYVTCSLQEEQNELVVQRFLSNSSQARVVEIEQLKHAPAIKGNIVKESLLFTPEVSNTSGLFIVKFLKL